MPRIDAFWRERVRVLTEQDPKLSSRKIALLLEAQGAEISRTDWPSEKSIRNIMAEHRAASEQERRQYGQAFWPESFGNSDLPWEAASAVFEAMDLCGDGNRPTVRTAKWYWRLTLAAPGAPPKTRLEYARYLAACEATELPKAVETWRNIEWRLVHPGMEPPEPLSIWTTPEAMAVEGIITPAMKEFIESRRLYTE